MRNEAPLTIVTRLPEPPAVEIRVNFGLFAGREATQAELDALGRALVTLVPELAVVGERMTLVGTGSEASLHQVRVDVPPDSVPTDDTEAERVIARLVDECERWARSEIADRRLTLDTLNG